MDDKVLEVIHVSKKRGHKIVLDDINFSIDKGEICGFVGRNGAGKTTLIKIITSMLYADKGKVIICGKNLKTEREEALRNVGALVETPIMYEYMTGRQNLNHISSVIKDVTEGDRENAIKLSNLGVKIDEKVKKYSLGMKQRLGIAEALMGNVSLLILDEPTNGLDPVGVFEFKSVINNLARKKGVSIFISSHILSEIENICTKIVFIDKGKIISVQKMDNSMKAANEKNIFIKTDSPKESSKVIQSIPYVKLLKIENKGISILINSDINDIFEILKKLHDAKISVQGFFELKQNLEDKFIKMMGEDRDE
ncbi:ABC transporter ATP-binding protein [Clostridium sp.]|uniref:ABC transporter ATP-binding protein n=1 Tax=Clostridium sp. TaxID=1506 RepID=UPI002FDE852E